MTSILMKVTALALLTFMLFSCSETVEEMDEWEAQLASELKATNVQLLHMSTSTTTNGIHTSSDVYLQLNIVNSEVIDKIDHNERILTQKCDEIREKVVSRAESIPFPAFNELKINLIEKRGALIFKAENSKTISLQIH